MTDNAFDPYFKWLGISPADQPPTHYRLLGIDPFTSDGDVISNAADRQMMLLRTFQTGERAAASQRLLNEIAAARTCLLDPNRKAAYDQSLRQRQAAGVRPAVQMVAQPVAQPVMQSPPAAMPPAAPRVPVGSAAPQQVARPAPAARPASPSPDLNLNIDAPLTAPSRKLKAGKSRQANSKVLVFVIALAAMAVLLPTLLIATLMFLLRGDSDDPLAIAAAPTVQSTEVKRQPDTPAGQTPAGQTTAVASAGTLPITWTTHGQRDWQFKSGDVIEADNQMQVSSWLMLREQYSDFTLTVDYLLEPKGAGGVYIRVPEDASWPWSQGFEIHFKDDFGRPVDSKMEGSGAIWKRAQPTVNASLPAGQWNTTRIECRGPDITVWLNGRRVVEYRAPASMSRGGHLGLDGVTGGITYRNLKVVALP